MDSFLACVWGDVLHFAFQEGNKNIYHTPRSGSVTCDLRLTSMLVTDVENHFCCWHVWDVSHRIKMLAIDSLHNKIIYITEKVTNIILWPTSYNCHHDKVTSISVIDLNSGTMILVTSLCWWLYDCDWFQMLVAKSLCWRLFSLCWWFSQWIKSVTNMLNRSSTHVVSNIRHQHRCNLWILFDISYGF